MSKGKKFVYRDGQFVEGKAGPALLPEHLRKLPSDHVTKDIGDELKIHELDPPHIVASLQDDLRKAEEETKDPTAMELLRKVFEEVYTSEQVPVTQLRIDVVRFAAIRGIVGTQFKKMQKGHLKEIDWSVKHLWFPTPWMRTRELRKGVAPGDVLRPAWLKHMALEVDIAYPPPSILNILRDHGIPIPQDVKAMWKLFTSDSKGGYVQ